MKIKKKYYEYIQSIKKVDGKYDVDHISIVIENYGLENILDLDFFELIGILEDHDLLILLASIGSESAADVRPYKRILAAYQVYLGISSPQDAVAYCEAAGYANSDFYFQLFTVAKNKNHDISIKYLQLHVDELEFGIQYLIDIHQPTKVPVLLNAWMNLDPERAWLKTCRLIALREELVMRKSFAFDLAELLQLCINCAPFAQRGIVDSLYSRLASYWIKAGKGELALSAIKNYQQENDDSLGRHLELRALLLDNNLPAALVKAEEVICYTVEHPQQIEATSDQQFSDFDPHAAERTLKIVNSALRDRGLKPFLMSGTLLGYLRNGKILPHDKDVDIGIIGWENQFEVAQVLTELGHFHMDYERLRGRKTFLFNPKDIKNLMAIDIFFFHDEGDYFLHGIDFQLGYTQNYKFSKFGLREVLFLDEPFFIPDHPELNMEENYGNWLESIPGYVVTVESPAIVNKGGIEHKISAHVEIIKSMTSKPSNEKIQRIINYSNSEYQLISEAVMKSCVDWLR
jgi:hypothetical protein